MLIHVCYEMDMCVYTQGHADTEHVIKAPTGVADIVGLKSKKCKPCEGKNAVKLSEEEADKMRMIAGSGWRMEKNDKEHLMIAMDVTVKNFTKGLELFKRVAEIAEEEVRTHTHTHPARTQETENNT